MPGPPLPKSACLSRGFPVISLWSFALVGTQRAFSSRGGIGPCAQGSRRQTGEGWRAAADERIDRGFGVATAAEAARTPRKTRRRPGVSGRYFHSQGVPSTNRKMDQRPRRRRLGFASATASRPLFVIAPLLGRRRAPRSRTAPLVHGGQQKMQPGRSAWCICRRNRPPDTCHARRRGRGPSMPR